MGRYSEAIRAFNRSIKIDPTFADAWSNKGQAFFYLGKYNESIDVCNQALKISPASVLAWIIKGYSLASLGMYDEATKSLETALRLDPKLSSLSWYYKGLKSLANGEYEKSIFYFDRALEAYPNSELFWNDRGVALEEQGKFDEALKSFEKAIDINPNFVVALYNKGQLFYIIKDYKEAIRYFNMAIKVNSNYIDAWLFKGIALKELEKYNESIQSLDWAILLNPKNEIAWHEKGLLLYEIGRYNESIRAFDRALLANPVYVLPLIGKGVALDELGRYGDAIECYNRAIQIDPNSPEAWNNKGVSLYNIGRLNDSIDYYERSILLNPQYALPWNNKARALFALGRDDEAIKVLARAKELAGYEEPELVEAASVRGHFGYGNDTWKSNDFGWFYYDLDNDLGGETLRIELKNRTAEKGHITYSSTPWIQHFEYEPWGSFQAISYLGKLYFAGYPNSSFSREVSLLEKGDLRPVLLDDSVPQTLHCNEGLILPEEYKLIPMEISEKNNTVNFVLLKRGELVFESVVSVGRTLIYKRNDIPVIWVHLADIIPNDGNGLVEVDGTFQISDEPNLKLYVEEAMGEMEVVHYSDSDIELKNNRSINFIRNSTLTLNPGLEIIILDDQNLVYYPQGKIYDYGMHEIRGPVFNANASIPIRLGNYNSSAIARWNAENFSGFYIYPDNKLITPRVENLVIFSTDDRQIMKASHPIIYPENMTSSQNGLQYTSLLQPMEFEYKPWGHYYIISLFGSPWFAGYDSILDGKNSSRSLFENKSLNQILLDIELEGNLSEGNYSLEDGYEMQIGDISNGSLSVRLFNDRELVDSSVVISNMTYEFKKDLENVKDMPILMIHFGNIFYNGTHNLAAIDGIFQISDSEYTLELGSVFGKLELVSIQPDGFIFINPDNISLNRNAKVNIGPGINIRVANNNNLRYYLHTSKYVVPSPEPPRIKFQENVSSLASANFSMIVRAAEISEVMVLILDPSNKTVFAKDITGLGRGSGEYWIFDWIWNASIIQMSDNSTPVLRIDIGNDLLMAPALLYQNHSASPLQVGVIFDMEGSIDAIMDGTSFYYISRGTYARLNRSLDYDSLIGNDTARIEFFKIDPGESILQFLDITGNQLMPCGINHTIYGNLSLLEPHAIILGARPGRYELQVRIENAVNALWATEEFFNVTNLSDYSSQGSESVMV